MKTNFVCYTTFDFRENGAEICPAFFKRDRQAQRFARRMKIANPDVTFMVDKNSIYAAHRDAVWSAMLIAGTSTEDDSY